MSGDPQTAAYAAFRGEFEAWHFRSERSTHTGTQPDSVPTSPDTEGEQDHDDDVLPTQR